MRTTNSDIIKTVDGMTRRALEVELGTTNTTTAMVDLREAAIKRRQELAGLDAVGSQRSDPTIPSFEQCRTALRRIEADERTGNEGGVVTSRYVLAGFRLEYARMYLGRIAAYEELGGEAPHQYIREVREALICALGLMHPDTEIRGNGHVIYAATDAP